MMRLTKNTVLSLIGHATKDMPYQMLELEIMEEGEAEEFWRAVIYCESAVMSFSSEYGSVTITEVSLEKETIELMIDPPGRMML